MSKSKQLTTSKLSIPEQSIALSEEELLELEHDPELPPDDFDSIPERVRDKNYIFRDYEVINYIGKGSFGKVYLVEHIKTGIEYALKIQEKKMIDECYKNGNEKIFSYARGEQ
jgi:serine/threonine protein kinase